MSQWHIPESKCCRETLHIPVSVSSEVVLGPGRVLVLAPNMLIPSPDSHSSPLEPHKTATVYIKCVLLVTACISFAFVLTTTLTIGSFHYLPPPSDKEMKSQRGWVAFPSQ